MLRLAEGKTHAEIYDFITLPRQLEEVIHLTEAQLLRERGLVKRELARAKEFARLSTNFVAAEILISEIEQAYRLDSIIDREWEE